MRDIAAGASVWLVVVGLAGCASSASSVPSTPLVPAVTPPPAPSPTPPKPADFPVDGGVATAQGHGITTSSGPGCEVDAAAERACRARGAGFSYGPAPFIYCSGVAADTGALARRHNEDQRGQPCSCNDEREISQRRSACSRVPSAAPGPDRLSGDE